MGVCIPREAESCFGKDLPLSYDQGHEAFKLTVHPPVALKPVVCLSLNRFAGLLFLLTGLQRTAHPGQGGLEGHCFIPVATVGVDLASVCSCL